MRLLLLLLFISLSTYGIAQQDTVQVKVYPNPFDSVAIHTIQLNEGDQFSAEFLTIQGKTLCSVPVETYFRSVQFSEEILLGSPNVYFSILTINEEQIVKKLVFNGQDSTFYLQFNLQVTPSKFEKETLKIFPNPSVSDLLTIETETESRKVDFLVYDMHGQLLYEKEIVAVGKNAKTSLLVSNWKSGQYIVKMTSDFGEDQKIFTKISK